MVEELFIYKKTCTKCNEEKLQSEFAISKGYASHICLDCKRVQNQVNRAKRLKKQKTPLLENPYSRFDFSRSKS